MTRLFYVTVFLSITSLITAQTTELLRHKIEQIVAEKNVTVGVAINGNSGKDTLSINGDTHFPMQSVFKFHIALALLSEVDRGRFSLNQKVEIRKEDLIPDLYSPLREDYPNGVTLPISKILEYTVSSSDNVGCEVVLKLIGGPKVVDDYFINNEIKDISIKLNEVEQQANWDLQFQNWTTPKAANEVLTKFYYNAEKLLSKKSYDFIWKVMKETETGQNRLKGQLPKGTIIAHKTGSSGTNNEGLTAAVNDIGIVFLPNGQHFFISVFVTNSKEDAETNEKLIADIAIATWNYFIIKTE
ncbi:MAG: class A beta-lactamase, subclass A2 [Bacteroidales bacterium]|jgi:beta-lactamase class A/beta-lactamase class A VEB